MKGEQLFFYDERVPSGLPLDDTLPLAAWSCLTVRSRTAWYLADVLSAIAEIQQVLATDAAAHLRWIEPQLELAARETDRVLKGLAC